jgi:uncharacterized protein with ParB-like and HNH nuclease domain
MNLTVSPEQIGKLLVGLTKIKVPSYQRPYSWDEEKVDAFWNDIIRVIENSQDTTEHFLGSLVLQKNQDSNDFFLVDGQQRMTTILLLLAAIFDERHNNQLIIHEPNNDEKNKNIATIDSIQQHILITPHHEIRLTLHHEHNYFKNLLSAVLINRTSDRIDFYLNSANNNPNCETIYENYANLREKLREYISNNSSKSPSYHLKLFTETILWKLYIVQIVTQTQKQALIIFRTLNSRGMDLNPSDIIKALLIERSNEKKIETIWEDTEKQLNQITSPSTTNMMTRYIRHLYISQYNYILESDLVDEFDTKTRNSNFSNQIIRNIGNEKEAYLHIASGGEHTTPFILNETKTSLFHIAKRLKITAVYPLLLASYAHAKKIDSREYFQKSCLLIESFIFRHYTCGRKISIEGIEKLMGELAVSVRNNKQVDITKTLSDLSNDDIFKTDFEKKRFKQSDIAYYTMWKIESYLSAQTGGFIPYTQSPTQHLEHILPKTPNVLSDWGLTSKSQHEEYVHKIGNHLILESNINTSIKNKNLTFKLKNSRNSGYVNSVLIFPRELAAFAGLCDHRSIQNYQHPENYIVTSDDSKTVSWTMDSIDKRQKSLSLLAPSVWNLNIQLDN